MKTRQLAVSFIGTIIRVLILVLIIYGVINLGKKAYDFGYRIFTEEPMSAEPGRDISIVVSSGDSMTDIAKMLEEKGLCRDWMLFYIQAKLSEYKEEILPGNYTLNTCMTTDDMLIVLEKIATEDEELEPLSTDEQIDPETVSNPGADELIDSPLDEYEGEEYSGEETAEDAETEGVTEDNSEGTE